MKKLRSFIFVLFAFGCVNVFPMKNMRSVNMVSTVASFSDLQEEITVYFSLNEFETLLKEFKLRDHDLLNYNSLKTVSVNFETIADFLYPYYIKLPDSGKEVLFYIPATSSLKIDEKTCDFVIKFVEAKSEKYKLTINTVEKKQKIGGDLVDFQRAYKWPGGSIFNGCSFLNW